MSKFQLIVIGIFIVFIVVGVVSFANYKGTTSTTQLPTITIWGTFPKSEFDTYISTINNTFSQQISINYIEKNADQFLYEFISALARSNGPDAILVPADILLPYADKLALIPYSALTQREFMDRYIQEAEIYLSENGIMALPFTVDPLMMYWNKDVFNNAGVATYPRYWDEFAGLNKTLTARDSRGNITKSALAFGHFNNITNAREILGTLFMQSGNPITTYSRGNLVNTLKTTYSSTPAAALEFFTQSANPNNNQYSWNRSMPISKTAFLSGILATYFGFASEIADIRSKNPNLNFDVANIPQIRKSDIRATFGRMYGFSLVRSSQNLNSAYQIISLISSSEYLKKLSESLYLPSVRRDVIANGSNDPYIQIFNKSALISKTWIDADPAKSREIFANMVDNIVTGRRSMSQSIQDGGDQFDVMLKQAIQ